MKIEFSEIIINTDIAFGNYGFGEYGLGTYFCNLWGECLFFIPDNSHT